MYSQIIRVVLFCLIPMWVLFNSWTNPAWALTEEQKLLNEAWRIVNQAYLDESFNHQNWWTVRDKAIRGNLENREATYQAIEKMLGSLGDPFTRLLKPDQYRSLQVSTSGELMGVGLQIALDGETGELVVLAPIAGSPAEGAGVQSGDRILAIDGQMTTGLTLDEAANLMRGPAGTPVTLTLTHESSAEPEAVEIVRDRIVINPVAAELKSAPNGQLIGYIRLSQFSANATEEVAKAVEKLEKKGAQGYILDLRNNPGGLLQAGIEVARLWLEQGAIVYTVNRYGVLDSFDATHQALTDAPLAVLVNRGTASASEILAGALQDNGRAILVGERTFGKGLIQSLFDLSDGAGLAVTVAKYETPNHTDINRQGITPDYIQPLEPIRRTQIATETDRQYQKALEVLTGKRQ